MSMFYNIELVTEYSFSECRDILLNGTEYETLTNTSPHFIIRTKYLTFSMKKIEVSKNRKIFLNELGNIQPTISIYVHSVINTPELYRMFMRWVHFSNETALLIHYGEKILLFSQDGKLIRNNDPMIWRDDVNEVIDKEYTLKRFPTL